MTLIHRLEPFFWIRFGAGGFVIGFFLPGLLIAVTLLAPAKKSAAGLFWGVGGSWAFPTASAGLGTDRWAAGPAAVAFHFSKDWVFGLFPQQQWSYAKDDSDSETVSRLNVQ